MQCIEYTDFKSSMQYETVKLFYFAVCQDRLSQSAVAVGFKYSL